MTKKEEHDAIRNVLGCGLTRFIETAIEVRKKEAKKYPRDAIIHSEIPLMVTFLEKLKENRNDHILKRLFEGTNPELKKIMSIAYPQGNKQCKNTSSQV